MVHSTIKRSSSGMKLESFEKFSSIPIVESGIHSGLKMYNRFKRTNRLVNWGLETSENIALSMIESVCPALRFIEGPLEKIDKFGLKVLEQVEERAPNLYLPPQMLYWNTKEYVSDHVVKPVLKRADSIGDIVDGAIDKADNALDKYLPDKDCLNNCEDESHDDCVQRNHAFRTIRRSQRLSKKLRKKIRSRTVAEVRALKVDVHILIYAAELIVTNPKEAYFKFNELWGYLSDNEPENQKRPETIEELFVLIMRETARKFVHLMNFVTRHLSKIPKRVRSAAIEFFHHVLYFTDSFLKMIHIEKAENVVKQISCTYDEVQKQTTSALNENESTETPNFKEISALMTIYLIKKVERLAIFFSGRLEAEKIEMSTQSRIFTRINSNGLY